MRVTRSPDSKMFLFASLYCNARAKLLLIVASIYRSDLYAHDRGGGAPAFSPLAGKRRPIIGTLSGQAENCFCSRRVRSIGERERTAMGFGDLSR